MVPWKPKTDQKRLPQKTRAIELLVDYLVRIYSKGEEIPLKLRDMIPSCQPSAR